MGEWIIIIISLIFSAFFSGMEIAFLCANRLHIELQRRKGILSARIISRFVKMPAWFIGAMLAGNNIALVVYSITMAQLIEPQLRMFTSSDLTVFVIQTILSTLLVLVAGEFIPKTIFRVIPNKIIFLFALPVWLIYHVLYPLVFIMIKISELVMKKFLGVELSEERPAFGRIDIEHYIKESASYLKEKTAPGLHMFRNALYFSEVKVRECMIPRTEIIAIEVDEPITLLSEMFIETQLSKIVIYRENIDNLIGYTHSLKLFNKPENIKDILIPLSIVPESMGANEMLRTLIRQRRSMACVVDEFGGTAGIVTIEDVMEEIFGEIVDEHDVTLFTETKVSEIEYIFSGRLEIDYINNKYDLSLPVSEEYETLSGMIIYYHESIPKVNEVIKIGKHIFTIGALSGTRIEKATVRVAGTERRRNV